MTQERGYTGTVWPLRRFVRGARPRDAREAFFRLSTLPGEQGQVDWASFGSITIGTTPRPLSCFVMVLSPMGGLHATGPECTRSSGSGDTANAAKRVELRTAHADRKETFAPRERGRSARVLATMPKSWSSGPALTARL